MFVRSDNRIVTQAEHSRLSGAFASLLGRTLNLTVCKLAGAIALHDWPHFSGPDALIYWCVNGLVFPRVELPHSLRRGHRFLPL